jgi:hypothetical protein
MAVKLSALRTGPLYPQEVPGALLCLRKTGWAPALLERAGELYQRESFIETTGRDYTTVSLGLLNTSDDGS